MAIIVKANNTTALNLGGSWVGGVAPTSADVGKWDNTVTGANAVALGGALSVLGVQIANPGGAVTIQTTTATFTIGTSGIDMSSATQNLTISSPVTVSLNGNQTWNVASGRTLSVGSNITGTSQLQKSGTGTATLGGTNDFGGTTLTVSAGTLTATSTTALGANTNGRSIIVSSGATLNVGVGALNYANVPLTIGSTGVGTLGGLVLANTGTTTFSAVTLTANTRIRATDNATLTASGAITTGASTKLLRFLVLAGKTLTLANAPISGDGDVLIGSTAVVGDTGTVRTTSTNTYTAITTVDLGTFEVAGAGSLGSGTYANTITIGSGTTFSYASTASQTLSGAIISTGTLSKSNTGTLTLSGNNTFSGPLNLSAGKLIASSATALGNNSARTITVTSAVGTNDGTELNLASATANNYSSVSLSIAGIGLVDQGVLILSGAGSTTLSTITLSANTRVRATETTTLSASTGGIVLGSNLLRLSAETTKTLTVSSAVISGAGGVFYGWDSTTLGTVTLTSANTYTGTSTLTAGTVNLGVAEVVGTSGPLGASAASNPGNIVFAGGTLQYSTSNQNDYSGRFSTAASQPFRVDTNGQDVTWSVLRSTGGSLTKLGTGTLSLTDATPNLASVAVQAGTVALATTTTDWQNTSFTLGSGSTSGVLQIGTAAAARTVRIDYLQTSGTGTANAVVAGGAAADSTLEIWTVTSSTFSGVIGGTGTNQNRLALEYYGSGATLTLSEINTYTGGTTILRGTLKLNNGGALGCIRGALTVGTISSTSTSTVELAATDAFGSSSTASNGVTSITLDDTVQPSSINITSAGNQTIKCDVDMQAGSRITGTFTSGSAGLYFRKNSAGDAAIQLLASGDGTVIDVSGGRGVHFYDGEAYIEVQTANDLTISSRLSDAVSAPVTTIDKRGGGNLILNNASNDYTGGTKITDGTVTIGAATALGTGTLEMVGTLTKEIDVLSALTISNPMKIRTFDFIGTANLTQQTGAITFETSGSGIPATQIIDIRANTLRLNGNISITVPEYDTYRKQGVGTLVLGGVNSLNAAVPVTAGTLAAANTAALSGAALSVDTDSTLAALASCGGKALGLKSLSISGGTLRIGGS